MNAPTWLVLALSAGTDFLIAGGGTLMGAIVESGQKTMPSAVVILVAVLAGLIAGAKELRSQLRLPDVPHPVVVQKGPTP